MQRRMKIRAIGYWVVYAFTAANALAWSLSRGERPFELVDVFPVTALLVTGFMAYQATQDWKRSAR